MEFGGFSGDCATHAKTVAISALCGTCDARMNKGGSLAKLIEIQADFGLHPLAQESLAANSD